MRESTVMYRLKQRNSPVGSFHIMKGWAKTKRKKADKLWIRLYIKDTNTV